MVEFWEEPVGRLCELPLGESCVQLDSAFEDVGNDVVEPTDDLLAWVLVRCRLPKLEITFAPHAPVVPRAA